MPIVAMVVVALSAIAALRNVPAQHVWESDVMVRSLELTMTEPGAPITARVVVAAGRDAARAVRLEVMLPVGVGVVRMPPVCRASPSPVLSLSARVTCTLGELAARGARELTITTTGTPALRGRVRFAVFALSDTPDPVPSNNFAERALP